MPRAPAKKKIKMCVKCNGDFVEQFQKLLEGKNIAFATGCVGGGKCGTKTPFCKMDKEILEAPTLEELAALIP